MLANFFISFRISDKNKVVLFKSKGTVSGRITDSETGAALFFTNVFLANTTKGSTTDKNGYYSISNIPEGDYTLVVQHIGFEVETIPVPMQKPELLAVDVKLTPKIIKGEAINVIAEQETQFTKESRLFKKMFLGE